MITDSNGIPTAWSNALNYVFGQCQPWTVDLAGTSETLSVNVYYEAD